MFYWLNSIRSHHQTVDLKSLGPRLYGFESRRPHQIIVFCNLYLCCEIANNVKLSDLDHAGKL